ncbi:MAG: hypothetical protein IKW30_04530 [Lachnospiraceae bacterium]|nr:hypothetical protein [Lachnospiraceae bacterium]
MNYNISVNQLIKNYCQHINLDFNFINRIYIITSNTCNNWLGTVEPIKINNNLYLDLKLHQCVIDDLNSENNIKFQIAHSIIMHELYHCKEMTITSSYLEWQKLYFHESIRTTKLLFLDTAFHQWSEYYAYYNSSKINKRKIKLSEKLSSANASLKVSYNHIKETKCENMQLLKTFIDSLIDFISVIIMFSAHYNSTHDKKYIRELRYIQRSSLYSEYYPYIVDIISYMDVLYNTYPKWITMDNFIELGHKLFSFMKINHIYFATNDISDNFEIKIV